MSSSNTVQGSEIPSSGWRTAPSPRAERSHLTPAAAISRGSSPSGDTVPSADAHPTRQQQVAALLQEASDLQNGYRPWETYYQDAYSGDSVRAFWVNPTAHNGPPFSFDPSPSSNYCRVGYRGVNLGRLSYDARGNTCHDSDAFIAPNALQLSEIWNSGSVPGTEPKQAIDFFLSDGWASLGYSRANAGHDWSVFAGGWGGPDSYACIGGAYDNYAGWVCFGANRSTSARRLSDVDAAAAAKRLGLQPTDPVYRLNIKSKVDTSLSLKAIAPACAFRLDLVKGTEWEWSTLVGRERAHRVLFGNLGMMKYLENKAKAVGFSKEDVDIDLGKPESLRVGDRVTVTQKGEFSLAAAGGAFGVYAGVIARASGTVRTSVIKTSETELVLVREPLDVKSVTGFVGTPVGLQVSINRANAKDLREAFKFKLDPSNPLDPVKKAFIEAVDGRLPCELHRLEVKYEANTADNPAVEQAAAHMALVAKENEQFPAGIERLFVAATGAVSTNRNCGLYFFIVPRDFLPAKVENTLATHSTHLGFTQTMIRGDGKLAVSDTTVSQRDDWYMLTRGHQTHQESAAVHWVLQSESQSSGQGVTAPVLGGLVCRDRYDDSRIGTAGAKNYIINGLNSRYGFGLQLAKEPGHLESRTVQVQRLFTASELSRLSKQAEPTSQDLCGWCEGTGLSPEIVRAHLSTLLACPPNVDSTEESRAAAVSIGTTESTRARALVAECLRFYEQHGSKATILWHRMLGGSLSEFHVTTSSDAYESPAQRADHVALAYPNPIRVDDRDVEQRFHDVLHELKFIRDVALPVLREDPFSPEAERETILAHLLGCRQQLLDIIRVDHLSALERLAVIQKLHQHWALTEENLLACDYIDRDLTPALAADRLVRESAQTTEAMPQCSLLPALLSPIPAAQRAANALVLEMDDRVERTATNPLLTSQERRIDIDRLSTSGSRLVDSGLTSAPPEIPEPRPEAAQGQLRRP